jgi:MSHA biogenesis protein MshQ
LEIVIMFNAKWFRIWRALAAMLWSVCAWMPAHAGWNAYTSGDTGFNSPTVYANERTIDFSTGTPVTASANNSLTSEQTASRLTFSKSLASGASFSETDTSSATGMSGKHVKISSGTSGTASTMTVTFANGGTSYVAFDWYLGLKDQNAASVKFNFSDGTSQTLYSCNTSTTSTCLGAYVPSNWLSNLFNLLTLCLFGCNQQDTVYLTYLPSTGVKITSVIFSNNVCNGCGFLGFDASQDMYVDNIVYVDPTIAPHHLEITTTNGTVTAGTNITFTIKSCADAACSTTFTTGMTGTLSLTGTGMTATYPSGQTYSIGARSSSTTLQASITPAGTATVALSAPSFTPTGSPSVYCGMGVPAASGNSCNLLVVGLHHLEVTSTSGTGVTCSPISYTIRACADAGCSSFYTSGLTGSIAVTGPTTVIYPSGSSFSIGSGSYSTTISAWAKTTGTATVSAASVPAANVPIYCGMGTSASSSGSCSVAVSSSALSFTVPNHVSDVSQAVSVSAVMSNSDATACVPAYASVTKSVTFTCSYTNPSSGTQAVKVGGTALNASSNASAACDGTGRTVSLNFNASGVASTTVQYADVGQMNLAATYTGVGEPSLSGSASFIVVPASLSFSSVTSAPIKAGNTFSATISAKNNSGNVTPNFGRETSPITDYVRLAWTKYKPAGVNSNEVFTGTGTSGSPTLSSGSFNNGAVTVSNLKWTEVGVGDLSASMASGTYLGASTPVVTGSTGSTGAVGPIVPDHFTISTSAGCGIFSYAGLSSSAGGQPFGVTITALNAAGATTTNYGAVNTVNASYPSGVTVSAASLTPSTTGTLSNTAVTSFSSGVATLSSSAMTSPSYSFSSKLTQPTVLAVRATDSTYGTVSSSGYTEGTVTLRSGRIKVSNAFGSQKTTLDVGVQAQYWNGKTWVLNSDDSCTKIPVASVALSNYLDAKGATPSPTWTTTPATKTTVSGVPMAVSFSNGSGTMTLSAPSTGAPGSVDFAFDLGATTTDQSCLATHPTITAATDMRWLRAQNGTANSCSGVTTYDRDPSARATFGVFAPETKKAVFVRDMY